MVAVGEFAVRLVDQHDARAPFDDRPQVRGVDRRSGRVVRAAQDHQRGIRAIDGLLDRREAAAYPWLERQFSGADRNGDGRVDRAELRGLAEQRRRQMQQPQP